MYLIEKKKHQPNQTKPKRAVVNLSILKWPRMRIVVFYVINWPVRSLGL